MTLKLANWLRWDSPFPRWHKLKDGGPYWLAIPKCGVSSVTELCERVLTTVRHRPVRYFTADVIMNAPELRIAVIRDPYDRLVSCYAQQTWYCCTFAEFVAGVCATPDDQLNPHARAQRWYIDNARAAYCEPNYYVDFAGMQEWFGSRGYALPHINPSKREATHTYYTGQLHSDITARFSDDISLHAKVITARCTDL